jgi:hypothetical protein
MVKKPINLKVQYLIVAFFVLLSSLFKIYFSPNGWLTSDSYEYLNHANSISYFSIFITCDPSSNSDVFFSTWPVGYPLLISIVSFISGLNSFFSSKILNFIFYFGVGMYFYKQKWENSLLLFMVFSIYLISYLATSISEFCFISASVIFLFEYKKKGFNFYVVLIGCLVFLFRYLGIFILFYIFLEFIIRRKKEDLIIFLYLGAFISIYLIFIKFNSGFISGANRIGTSSNRFMTFAEIMRSFFTLFSFFEYKNVGGKFGGLLYYFGILFFLPVVFKVLNIPWKVKISNHWFLFGFSYLLIYFIVILVPDWRHLNEPIPNRFLLPGFLFIIIGIFSSVSFCNISKRIIFLGVFLSFSFNGIVKPIMDYKKYEGLTYFKNIKNIKDGVEPSINSEKHLKYLKFCK